jgi:hypothetical protein
MIFGNAREQTRCTSGRIENGALMTGLSQNTSESDRFLFALLGKGDGISLSVVSVLARQDMDPWQEAAR